MTVGRHPETGKLKRTWFYGRTHKESTGPTKCHGGGQAAKREILPLTLPQVDQFLTAIERHRHFAAVFLELSTGLRRGELLDLHWQDIDLDAELLHVRQTLVRVRNHEATESNRRTALVFLKPKTLPSRRTIPIPQDIIVELKAHKAR